MAHRSVVYRGAASIVWASQAATLLHPRRHQRTLARSYPRGHLSVVGQSSSTSRGTGQKDFGCFRDTCDRDPRPLRSSVFKLRPISVTVQGSHSFISFSPKPPPSRPLVPTDASPSCEVADDASTGSGKLTGRFDRY